MTLIATIDQELIAAMKSADANRTAVLRLLKNSLKNEQIKLGHELSEDESSKVLQREAKQRKDSLQAYEKAGRAELAAEEQGELVIIETFLPKQLDEAALSDLVDEVIASRGVSSMADMGAVIGAVMQKAAGVADGASVSRIVREKLS